MAAGAFATGRNLVSSHRKAVPAGEAAPLAGRRRTAQPPDNSVAERFAAALLGQTSDAVFIVGRDFRIEWWGGRAEELLCLRAGDVLGSHCFDVVKGEHLARGLRCGPNCWAMQSARRGIPVQPFYIAVPDGAGCAGLFTLGFLATGGGRDVIHILRPAIETQTAPEATDRPGATGVESSRSRVGRLTPREQEILGLVAAGMSAREIADQLSISHATARNHVQNVLIRLGVHRRVDAAVLALHAGLAVQGAERPRAQ